MSQNQRYKQKYDELRDGSPAAPEKPDDDARAISVGDHVFYSAPGNTRDVCFAWPNGTKLSLNYFNLISKEFSVDEENNIIKLGFTSHTILLKGFQLEELFNKFREQLPALIIETDLRYTTTQDGTQSIVVGISIELVK